MGTSIAFEGDLVASPGTSGSCGFPAAITNVHVSARARSYAEKVNLDRQISSPSAFVALEGIGAGLTIEKGLFLYLKTNATFTVELTTQPDSGPDVVAVIPLYGTMILEFPDANYLKLLRVKGVGTVEYVAAGS